MRDAVRRTQAVTKLLPFTERALFICTSFRLFDFSIKLEIARKVEGYKYTKDPALLSVGLCR